MALDGGVLDSSSDSGEMYKSYIEARYNDGETGSNGVRWRKVLMGAAAQMHHVKKEEAWYNKVKKKFALINIHTCRHFIKDYFKINRRLHKERVVEMFQSTLECILTMILMEVDDEVTIGLGQFLIKVGAALGKHDSIEWGVTVLAKMEKVRVRHVSQLVLRHRTVNMELIKAGESVMRTKTWDIIMAKAADLLQFKALERYEYAMYDEFIGNRMDNSDSESSGSKKPRANDRSMNSMGVEGEHRRAKKSRTSVEEEVQKAVQRMQISENNVNKEVEDVRDAADSLLMLGGETV